VFLFTMLLMVSMAKMIALSLSAFMVISMMIMSF
jgi:hypothetical protein